MKIVADGKADMSALKRVAQGGRLAVRFQDPPFWPRVHQDQANQVRLQFAKELDCLAADLSELQVLLGGMLRGYARYHAERVNDLLRPEGVSLVRDAADLLEQEARE